MKSLDVIAFASAFHDKGTLATLKKGLIDRISKAGGFKISEVKSASPDRLTAVLILTGGVERQVLRGIADLPSPILLIAHDAQNSLPASLEILARIRHDGGEGRILFGTPEKVAADLTQEMAIAEAWNRLRFSRVGLIGEPSEWLVASDVDKAFLKGRLSIETVEVDIEELMTRVDLDAPPKKLMAGFTKKATDVKQASQEEIAGAGSIYDALRSLIDEHRLAACTVRCFDLVLRMENTGCYALSKLNDEGTPAGCEGDMQALLSLYTAYLLTGQTAFMGNIASVDTENEVIGIAHCTCPVSMTASYAITSHFESGLGVGLSGDIPEGPCTLFRLGGERLDHLFAREGQIEKAPFRDDLCRTQVRIQCQEPIDELLTAPLGNHHILLAGHHRDTLERFFGRYLAT